jgi:hypothetical protein
LPIYYRARNGLDRTNWWDAQERKKYNRLSYDNNEGGGGFNMVVDPAAAALLGTVLGAVLGFFGKVVSDWMSLRKERETREDQRKAESAKWQQEQLQHSLSSAIKSLNLYITKAINKPTIEERQKDPELQQASAEAQSWLVSLLAVYPEKSAKEYAELVNGVDRPMWKAVPDVGDVWDIRQLIVKLATRFGTTWFVEK